MFNKDKYCYENLVSDLNKLKSRYNISIFSIGSSVENRNIYAFRLGNGRKKVFINGAHHALEWITTPLIMRFANDLLEFKEQKKSLYNFNINTLFNKVTYSFVPMVNPDGINLTVNGIKNDSPLYQFLSEANGGENFSTGWQSNIRGVDLNHNYDAGFYRTNSRISDKPSNTRYPGIYPESEPETKAVADFARNSLFDLAVAYHTQGEVIYYNYNNIVPQNGYEIAKIMSSYSGYLPDEPKGAASFGGFKDWFIKEFKKPAYTIEAGLGKNPLQMSFLDDMCRKNIPMLIISALLC